MVISDLGKGAGKPRQSPTPSETRSERSFRPSLASSAWTWITVPLALLSITLSALLIQSAQKGQLEISQNLEWVDRLNQLKTGIWDMESALSQKGKKPPSPSIAEIWQKFQENFQLDRDPKEQSDNPEDFKANLQRIDALIQKMVVLRSTILSLPPSSLRDRRLREIRELGEKTVEEIQGAGHKLWNRQSDASAFVTSSIP